MTVPLRVNVQELLYRMASSNEPGEVHCQVCKSIASFENHVFSSRLCKHMLEALKRFGDGPVPVPLPYPRPKSPKQLEYEAARDVWQRKHPLKDGAKSRNGRNGS